MTSLPDDEQLLQSFRRGEENALSQVYYQHVKEVARLIQRGFVMNKPQPLNIPGVHHPETEQDLVQEVFTRAFCEKARKSYDGQRAYRPYLLRIAKNVMIDHFRKQGNTITLDQNELEVLLSQEATENSLKEPDPEQNDIWKSQLASTKTYLSSLDKNTTEFVFLRFEQRKSQPELASLLGITRWQVRKTEKTLLSGLKRHLMRNNLFY